METITGSTYQAIVDGRLTRRQTEAGIWAAEGKTLEETGMIIGVKPGTVNDFLKAAMQRLDAPNKPALVAKMFSNGIIQTLCIVLCVASGQAPDEDLNRTRSRTTQRTRVASRSHSRCREANDGLSPALSVYERKKVA